MRGKKIVWMTATENAFCSIYNLGKFIMSYDVTTIFFFSSPLMLLSVLILKILIPLNPKGWEQLVSLSVLLHIFFRDWTVTHNIMQLACAACVVEVF